MAVLLWLVTGASRQECDAIAAPLDGFYGQQGSRVKREGSCRVVLHQHGRLADFRRGLYTGAFAVGCRPGRVSLLRLTALLNRMGQERASSCGGSAWLRPS